MSVFEFMFSPFLELDFMARALLASAAIAIAGAPVGVLPAALAVANRMGMSAVLAPSPPGRLSTST